MQIEHTTKQIQIKDSPLILARAGRKENAVHAYTTLLRMLGKTWTPPRYRRIDKDPWIPTETEVDQLIAGSSSKISTFLQLLKETGMRPGEA